MALKKLFIIRHGKAEEHSFSKRDFYRDLVERGIHKSNEIAKELKGSISLSEKSSIISSSANRAIQTANIFCQILNYPAERIHIEPTIYEAHYLDILKVINAVANDVDTLFVFGHNPGLSDLTNYITNAYIDLKTSNVALIEMEENLFFSEISAGTGTLKKIWS